MKNEKVILLRLTTKLGLERRECRSFQDAIVYAEDRGGSIEKATFAWAIYSADEKTCLKWSVYAPEALTHFGGKPVVGEDLRQKD